MNTQGLAAADQLTQNTAVELTLQWDHHVSQECDQWGKPAVELPEEQVLSMGMQRIVCTARYHNRFQILCGILRGLI